MYCFDQRQSWWLQFSSGLLLCCFISYSACSGILPHTRRHRGPLGLVGRCNETHLAGRHYPDNESGLSAVEGWQSHDTSYTPPGGKRGIEIVLLAKRHRNNNTWLLSTAEIKQVNLTHNEQKRVFWTLLTLTMLSLGSKLQSAKVRVSPSR